MDSLNQSLRLADRVALPIRIGWGTGGLTDSFMTTLLYSLALVIFPLYWGLPAAWVGLALGLPRIVDAVVDPLVGYLSDNTRSRWGRRRPYMLAGILLCAFLLPAIWAPPFQSPNHVVWWLVIGLLLYAIGYSLYVVPYTALGYELTEDQDERSRVLAWRMYIGLPASLLAAWYLPICLKLGPVFGKVSTAAMALAACAGVAILVTGTIPLFACRRLHELPLPAQRIAPWTALTRTLTSVPFVIMSLAYIPLIVVATGAYSINIYLNFFYVYAGNVHNQQLGARVAGWSSTLVGLLAYVSLPLLTWLSVRTSKKAALLGGMVLVTLGQLTQWFTITPKVPYLQLGSQFIAGLGLGGCWLMIASMIGDICDDDELKCGQRRQGLFSAVNSLTQKVGIGLGAILAGQLISWSGLDPEAARRLHYAPAAAITKLRIWYAFGGSAILLCASVFILFYPITRQRAQKTRELLDARRGDLPAAGR